MSLLSRHFENFFNDPFFDEFDLMIRPRALGQSSKKNEFGIICDVKETPTNFIISADLPGMKKEDIHVELKQDVISIHGDRGTKAKEEEFLLEERPRGKFHRRFALPSKEEIDISKINAEYKNGLLTISIPKKQVATKIKIK